MAHIGYKDLNRRELTLYDRRIEQLLPDYFSQEYPQFITFLKKYYEWNSTDDSPAELLEHLFETKDVSETDVTLLEFLEDELLLGESYFQGFKDKRSAAKISNRLYRSKGSKLSIQQFFKTFFDEDPDVEFTKEKIFKLNESEIGPESFKYITDDKLYQTYALLIKVGLPFSSWKEIYKLFVHPAGFYVEGQIQAVEEVGLGGSPFDGYDQMDSAGPLNPAIALVEAFSDISTLSADQGMNSYAVFDSSTTGGIGEVKLDLDRFHYQQFKDITIDPLATFTPTTLKMMGGFVVAGKKLGYKPSGAPGVDYDSSYVPSFPSFDVEASSDPDAILGSDPDFSSDSAPATLEYRAGLTTFDRN